MELFFDTETTGLCGFKDPPSDPKQPDIIQVGMVLSDKNVIYAKHAMLINPTDINPKWTMPASTEKIHGITSTMIKTGGVPARDALHIFTGLMQLADKMVCHNVNFDKLMVLIAQHRAGLQDAMKLLQGKEFFCTMLSGVSICKLPTKWRGAEYKWPKLTELHQALFGESFEGAHDALVDVLATRRCYYEMKERGL